MVEDLGKWNIVKDWNPSKQRKDKTILQLEYGNRFKVPWEMARKGE